MVFPVRRPGFDSDNSKRTLFYDVQWADGRHPTVAEAYQVDIVEAHDHLPPRRPTMSMVGDSVTWWQYGEYFRCLLADAGVPFEFIGSRTDVFGYGHEGEGGNKTTDVIARLDYILPSQNYFLLVGTNDQAGSEEDVVKRIMQIASALQQKQAKLPGEKRVYIGTILPRTDEFGPRNKRINALLRKRIHTCKKKCEGIRLIDTETAFLSQPHWKDLLAGELHPNLEGYRFLAGFLAAQF